MHFHRGRRGCHRMVVGFTTKYAISAYHHCVIFIALYLQTNIIVYMEEHLIIMVISVIVASGTQGIIAK
jgi:hypothetical protein